MEVSLWQWQDEDTTIELEYFVLIFVPFLNIFFKTYLNVWLPEIAPDELRVFFLSIFDVTFLFPFLVYKYTAYTTTSVFIVSILQNENKYLNKPTIFFVLILHNEKKKYVLQNRNKYLYIPIYSTCILKLNSHTCVYIFLYFKVSRNNIGMRVTKFVRTFPNTFFTVYVCACACVCVCVK